MLRVLQTFNDHDINDGSDYIAHLVNPDSLPPADLVFLGEANADSVDAGVYTVGARVLAVDIRIKNYANRIALISQLKHWFKRGTAGDLVALYLDDGLTYFSPCRVVNLVRDPDYPEHFTALLSSGWTTFRAVDPDTYAWSLTGTGGTHTVDLLGDDVTPLSATFTLSAGPADGYQYQRLYQLINAAGLPPLGFGPWRITMDTAALIADNSNKCQLNGAINASVTTIAYDTVTGSIPSIGMGYIGTEQIYWTNKTGTTSGNLTGVTRGEGGTTAASHADNVEIKLSYVQANCADVRIFIDGIETNRWVSGANTSTTKIWFNVNMSKSGASLTLRSALDNVSDYPSLFFQVTPDTYNIIRGRGLPYEGVLVHGTEWVKYVKNPAGPYRVDIVERGVFGTTKQAHAIGDVFKLQEHVITVCYGKPSAVDPSTVDATYDDTKPLFSLSSSDNTSWVYDATTAFYDTLGTGRTGGFTPSIVQRKGYNTFTYNIKQNATSGDPAMGMNIGSYLSADKSITTWFAEIGLTRWSFYRACGINTTTFTGEKYRTDANWPDNVGLRVSTDGWATGVQVWNEATPASAATWTALASHSAVAMAGVQWMRFAFGNSYPAAANSTAGFEILTGTIAFVSANLPAGSLLAQTVIGTLDLTLTNGANDNAIEIIRPMLIGLPLAIDAEAKTVLYSNVTAHDAVTQDDEGRDTWIQLETGNNILTAAATDVGTLTVDLSWYRRRF